MSEAASAVLAQHDIDPGVPAHDPAANPAQNSQESAPEAASRIAELRVSGNLMTLDTGLFCVFQAPGSPSPDPATGLPGVRVSLAPGLAGRPDTVAISTFRPDGWLDGTGALVRVKEGPAQILVTIYQAGRQSADTAPRLQVLRLNGEQAPAAPPPSVEASVPVEDPEVLAHVQRTGDVGGTIGDWIGVRGSRPWVEGGKFCGSRGMALPLLGFKLRLKGNAAKAFTCSYSATFIDGSAVGPIPAGESCEAESLAAMEAFHVELRPREGRQAHARTAKPKSAARPVRR